MIADTVLRIIDHDAFSNRILIPRTFIPLRRIARVTPFQHLE